MSGGSATTFEDQTVEDGELMHSPSDLQPPVIGIRVQPDVMDFSLSEEEEHGVRDHDMDEDEEDHMDSLVIKPPQAQVALGSQGSHQSSHRGSREGRRQQRDGHDRHGGGTRHDKHRGAVTSSEMGGIRSSKHRDHRERKKHKYHERDKERPYKQMMFPGEHPQHQGQINYAMEMAPHHSQMPNISNRSKDTSSNSSSSHHRGSNSSGGKHDSSSVDRSHQVSTNKRGNSSSSNRRGGNRVGHMVGTSEGNSGGGDDNKQLQAADRALKDLRDRLLSKRVSGKSERSNRTTKRTTNAAPQSSATDALEGEAGQLVKEIIDISTSAVQHHHSSGEHQLTEEEQAEKEVRRKRLLIAEREMSKMKEQSRQERQRRYQQMQQQEERQQLQRNDHMDDVVVVTLSSENSTSEIDDNDNDSIHSNRADENIQEHEANRNDEREDDDESTDEESGERRDVDDDDEDEEDEEQDEEQEEQPAKSRDSRDRERARDRKHSGSRRRHAKLRETSRKVDRGRRNRRDSSTDEGEESVKDAAGGDVSPGAPTSDNSRSRHRSRLSRSPKSPRSHSRSPHSRSRSPSRSRRLNLRSSRSRTRSRSPHRKSKTPPPSNITTKEPDAKKDTKADDIINIDETLPPYYPAIQGCRPVEEFRCLNRIEEGTYGVVYRAQDKRTREIVALKKLKMEKEKEGFPITSLREINTLLKGQHPNIVTVREIVVGSHMDKIFIVMDYVEHDLKSLMETMRSRRQAFSAGEVKCLLRQLLMAVAHLHDNWILHRDLKTSNLLLSHKGVLKVGDFGLAREYGSPLRPYTPIVVTLWYRAPELLLCAKEYSTPVDVWSVGCIMGELVLMNALFPGKSEVEQLTKIFKELGTPNETIWPDYPNLPAVKKLHFTTYPINSLHTRFPQLTVLGCGLLQAFLTYDPKQRVTAEAALKHDYFSEAPLAIDPAMFPTWPAKSELGVSRARAASPKPPSGGREYKQLGADADDPGFGFRIGISMADSRRLAAAAANAGGGSGGGGGGAGASGGFSLKF